MMNRLHKALVSLLLVSLLLVTTACGSEPPSRFDQAQQESTQKGAEAVSKTAEAGGSFNKFFPKVEEGYKLVYTQEKNGFAQAKLEKGDEDIAKFAISDISSTPKTADKYAQSTEKIAGYPVVNQGKTKTSVLVEERFQVTVTSSTLTPTDRKAWLKQFNLSGLSRL